MIVPARCFFAISFCLLLPAVSPGLQIQEMAVPLEGEPFAAASLRIDEAWQVTLETAEGPRQLQADQLISWGACVPLESGAKILLVDGTLLRAEVLALTRHHVIAHGQPWGEIRVPLPQVRGIIYRGPLDPVQHDRLIERLRMAEGTEDQILLDNGDLIRGRLLNPEDEQQLPLFGQTELRLVIDSTEVPVGIEKLVAVVPTPALRPRGSDQQRGRALLGLRNGTLLYVDQLQQAAAGDAQLKLTNGLLLPAGEQLWQEVVAVRFWNDRVSYLSDLPDSGYKHIPFLATSRPYQRDRNVLGGWLRSGDRIFSKGLGTYSASRLAYRLEGDERVFQAELAVDDVAEGQGSVVFRVFLHDGQQWRRAYESPVLRGGESPVPVSVALEGVRQLALIVDYADRAGVGDYANWLSARLVR